MLRGVLQSPNLKFTNMKYYFDVGANSGGEHFDLLARTQDGSMFLYLFEPNPYFCKVIKERYRDLKYWELIECAVSDFEGATTFNIANMTNCDGGCSSLFEFHPDINITWPAERTGPNGDLHFIYRIPVDVIRLDKFIEERGIDNIEHLHIDCQGADWDILIGLGDKISVVKSGRVEAADKAPLYKGSHHWSEFITFLVKKDFVIKDIHNFGMHECDIEYARK